MEKKVASDRLFHFILYKNDPSCNGEGSVIVNVVIQPPFMIYKNTDLRNCFSIKSCYQNTEPIPFKFETNEAMERAFAYISDVISNPINWEEEIIGNAPFSIHLVWDDEEKSAERQKQYEQQNEKEEKDYIRITTFDNYVGE